MYCCNEGAGQLSRRRREPDGVVSHFSDRTFCDPKTIEPKGLPTLIGRSPRYVAATHELFFTRAVVENGKPHWNGIWVIRNFVPPEPGQVIRVSYHTKRQIVTKVTGDAPEDTGVTSSVTANPNALPEAQAIMRYLRSLPARHDKKVVSGQFESWGTDVKPLSDSRNYVTIIHEKTGKWVGLVGVIYAAAKGVLYTEQPNDLCKEFWRKGGLVQVFAIFDNPANPESHGNGKCNIQLVLNPNHAYHRSFFRQLDGVATALEKLQDEGVVVFLNIFPEMSGTWFWWGGQNPELFKELYRTTFSYLVKKTAFEQSPFRL